MSSLKTIDMNGKVSLLVDIVAKTIDVHDGTHNAYTSTTNTDHVKSLFIFLDIIHKNHGMLDTVVYNILMCHLRQMRGYKD
jgi:hypothetical protein